VAKEYSATYHVDDDDTVTLVSFSTFLPLDSPEFLAHLLTQELAEFPLKFLRSDFTNPISSYSEHTQFSTEISCMLWSLKDHFKGRMSVFMFAMNLETTGSYFDTMKITTHVVMFGSTSCGHTLLSLYDNICRSHHQYVLNSVHTETKQEEDGIPLKG